MAIKLATKVSKINKVSILLSKTKILETLKISAKATKNKKYFKNLIKFILRRRKKLVTKIYPIPKKKNNFI